MVGLPRKKPMKGPFGPKAKEAAERRDAGKGTQRGVRRAYDQDAKDRKKAEKEAKKAAKRREQAVKKARKRNK